MPKLPLAPELFARVQTMLAQTAGLHFDSSKLNTLQTHLNDRAALQKQASLEDYVNYISQKAHADELRKLVESVTIHETSFFRNHEHYRALREAVLPDLARRHAADRRLRLWSAGCSTGEEPYSLAITCLEQPELRGWDIQIAATDLSERVLGLAQRGLYRGAALRYLEPDRLRRWFTRQEGDPPVPTPPRKTGPLDPLTGQREIYAVNDAVRALVQFQPLNLARQHYPDRYREFDLIICENVIIYFRPDVTRAVIAEFYNRLQPSGYLFLGYSETLWQISSRFELLTRPNTFYYRRPLAEPASTPATPPGVPGVPAPNLPEMLRRLGETGPATSRPSAPPPLPAPRPAVPPPPMRQPTTRPLPEVRPGGLVAQPLAPAATTPVADPERAVVEARQLTAQAHALLEAGKYTEAQAAFQAVLARNPAWVDALMGLAQIHANQGRLAEAQAECDRALDIDALCEEAHLLAALIARQDGRIVAAIDHFEKLFYINVESVAGHFHLAELYRAQGQRHEAAREYRRTLWALDRHQDATVSGLPAAMLQRTCEQQIKRLQA